MVIDVGTVLAVAPAVAGVNVKLLVRLICNTCPVGTVMTTGDHDPDAPGLSAAQVAVGAAFVVTAVPQL